jgi:hypothetical protein
MWQENIKKKLVKVHYTNRYTKLWDLKHLKIYLIGDSINEIPKHLKGGK